MTAITDHHLPLHLRKIHEKLIASIGEWTAIPDFAKPFLNWLILENVDQLSSCIGWEFAIEPSTLSSYWCDSEISEYMEDIPKGQAVTDDLRVECAKLLIDSSISELDDWMSVHAYPLPTAENPQAYLCATSEIWGQAGAKYWFHGVFSSKDDILRYLRDCGLWLLSDAENLSDEEILEYWSFEQTESEPKADEPPRDNLADSYHYWRDSLFFDLDSEIQATLKSVE